MEFGERLKELRERAGLSQDALASELNKSKSLISMYESGKRIPPYETQELIADFFNVGLDYLMGRENVYLTLNTSKPQRIPVLGSVPAGIPLEAIEDIVDYEEIPESMSRNGEFFGLRVNGESMVPVFNDGDTVIIQKQDSADTGDYVVAMINGGEATLKKLKRFDEGIILIPNNPEFFPVTYTNDQIESLPVRIIGKVVELRRKF